MDCHAVATRVLLLALLLLSGSAGAAAWGVSNTADTPVGQPCAGFTTVARVGAGAATIDGNGAARVFDISGAGTAFTLRFLTVSGGPAATRHLAAQSAARRAQRSRSRAAL